MIGDIFKPDTYRETEIFLSQAHLLVLIVFAISVAWIFYHQAKPYMKYIRWVLFGALMLSEVSLIWWTVSIGMWDIRYNLPLNLCTVSLYLAAAMLVTKSYTLFEIVYFFGIGGALQAMITPDLFYTFPHFRFLHFFTAHIAIILAVLYMIAFYKYEVTFRSFIKSLVVLHVLALIVFFINQMTGANYMFLARKPSGPSILDWFGPYPWYILALEAITFITFFILYLPFFIKKRLASPS